MCRCRLGSRQIAHSSPSVRLKHCEQGCTASFTLLNRLGQPQRFVARRGQDVMGQSFRAFAADPRQRGELVDQLTNRGSVRVSLFFRGTLSHRDRLAVFRSVGPLDVKPSNRLHSTRPARVSTSCRSDREAEGSTSSLPSRPRPLEPLSRGPDCRGNKQILQHLAVRAVQQGRFDLDRQNPLQTAGFDHDHSAAGRAFARGAGRVWLAFPRHGLGSAAPLSRIAAKFDSPLNISVIPPQLPDPLWAWNLFRRGRLWLRKLTAPFPQKDRSFPEPVAAHSRPPWGRPA